MAKGIHARGGIGRITSMIGSTALSKVLNHPIMIPKGIPTAMATPIPMAKKLRLVIISLYSSPPLTSFKKAVTTSVKLGRIYFLLMILAMISHIMIADAMDVISSIRLFISGDCPMHLKKGLMDEELYSSPISAITLL